MSVILDLSPEIEAELLAEAQAHGMTVEEFVASLVGRTPPKPKAMTPAERAAAFEAWAASHPSTPPLSDEAISREAIYKDDRI